MRSAQHRRRSLAGRAARVAVVVACLAASGCSTVGNGRLVQLEAVDAQALLVPGRTTQADVRRAFGKGTVIHFDSGHETWHYIYREGLAKGWDDVPVINLITSQLDRPTKELVILFDPAGVLKRYSLQAYRSTGSDTKTP
jgi:outer membrane protein assembly factor BamE (lipoprotein component of BamABCDE complex)